MAGKECNGGSAQPATALHPGIGDVQRLAAWEDGLAGKQLRDWQDLREALETVGPDMRTAAVSLCLELDLQDGRQAHSRSHKEAQHFKSDLIKRNGRALADQVKRLAVAQAEAMQALDAHRAIGAWATRLALRAIDAGRVVALARTSLQVVSGAWVNATPGAEWGKGITGYDTPDGVAAARAEHERRMAGVARERAAKHQRAVQLVQEPQVVQQVVSNAAAEAEQARLLAESAARQAVEAAAVKLQAPAGALFAQR